MIMYTMYGNWTTSFKSRVGTMTPFFSICTKQIKAAKYHKAVALISLYHIFQQMKLHHPQNTPISLCHHPMGGGLEHISVLLLKYVPKLQAHFVRFLGNFRNFRAANVFSSEMNSQYNEDNFNCFPSQEKRIQMQKLTPENLAFSVNFVFMLKVAEQV